MRFRTISTRSIVRRFVGVLAGAMFVLAAATAQDANTPSDTRPAAVRIRELADRGRAERQQGRIDPSIESFERAQEIAEETGDFRSAVILDGEIVTSLTQAGRYDGVIEILRGVEDRLEEHDDDPEFVAAVRVHVHSDISRVLQRLGRLHEALEEARRAVEIVESTGDPSARGSAYLALGSRLMWLDRPAEARSWLQLAADEFEDLPPSDTRRVAARMMLTKCAGELGNTELANELADEMVDELESLGSFPPALGSDVYALRGQLKYYRDWSGAEQDLRRSLELLEASGVDESRVPFQQATLKLAHAIRNAGRPEESAALERRALSMLREHHPATHPTAIWASQFLAASLRDLYDRTGNRDLLVESRALLEEAARLSREVDYPNSAMVFALLGELLLDPFEDPRAAEPWLRAAVDEIETRASGALALDESARADLSQQRRLRKRHDPYEGLLRCMVRLERPEEALDVLEHSRARSLTDLLERSRIDSLRLALERAEELGDAKAADRLRRLPVELDAAMASLAKTRAEINSDADRADARRAHEQVQRLDSERAELTRAVTTVGIVATVAEVRSRLGKDEILLAYFLGRKASFVCLAEALPGSVQWIPLVDEDGRSLTSDVLDARSREWIDALSRGAGDPARGLTPASSLPGREAAMTLAGHRLFRWLVPPAVWQRLQGRAIVHLLPHGPLNWLPFEALVVEPGNEGRAPKYWIDGGPAIAYQESGSALVWSQRRREEQEAGADDGVALIVADPDYGETESRPDQTAKGPVVVHVTRGGPAAREGLLVGDVLASLAGTKIESVEDFQRILGGIQDANGEPLVVVRFGIERSLQLPSGDLGLELAATLPPELKRGTNRSAAAPLERLPGTAREAAAVNDALVKRKSLGASSVRLLLGGEATETMLTAWSSRASILHVAAHQIPDPTGCSDSGRLALTAPPFPTAEDDGYLDLDDLLIHWRGRLDRCELVVLSSCWSRTGRLVRDEGFFGLPLGLRFAGCPSIVSSLWPVDDAATAELMSTFYESMEGEGGSSRLTALQRSKQELKRTQPDPYYWAAFLWSGAPR